MSSDMHPDTNKLKRDTQPEKVRNAKDAADRLAAYMANQGTPITRSQSLEALSQAAGAVDWNTFRAGLNINESDFEKKLEIADGVACKVLRLHPGCQFLCLSRITSLINPLGQRLHAYQNRALMFCETAIDLFYDDHERRDASMTALAFMNALTLDEESGYFHYLRKAIEHDTDSDIVLKSRKFLATVPELSIEDVLSGEPIHKDAFHDLFYLSMPVVTQISQWLDPNPPQLKPPHENTLIPIVDIRSVRG